MLKPAHQILYLKKPSQIVSAPFLFHHCPHPVIFPIPLRRHILTCASLSAGLFIVCGIIGRYFCNGNGALRVRSFSIASGVSFVVPMTGTSPFFTNSYVPGKEHQHKTLTWGEEGGYLRGVLLVPVILFAARRKASRATFSWISPLSSKMMRETGTRDEK